VFSDYIILRSRIAKRFFAKRSFAKRFMGRNAYARRFIAQRSVNRGLWVSIAKKASLTRTIFCLMFEFHNFSRVFLLGLGSQLALGLELVVQLNWGLQLVLGLNLVLRLDRGLQLVFGLNLGLGLYLGL
jgi:hypothetical protein